MKGREGSGEERRRAAKSGVLATHKARSEPRLRSTALMGLLYDPEGVRESYERQRGDKAPGVDGVRKEEYGKGLEERLAGLSERIRRLGYRPKPVRRR